MKKTLSILLALTLAVTAAAALAEDTAAPAAGATQEIQTIARGGRGHGRMPGNNQMPGKGQMPGRGRMPGRGGRRNDMRNPAQAPAQSNTQAPDQLPGLPDLDTLVTKGVISQDTADKIKAWLEEHKPADLPAAPADGQQPEVPADGQQPEAPAEGQQPDLLKDLLEAGIITQAEYESLSAEMAANQPAVPAAPDAATSATQSADSVRQ